MACCRESTAKLWRKEGIYPGVDAATRLNEQLKEMGLFMEETMQALGMHEIEFSANRILGYPDAFSLDRNGVHAHFERDADEFVLSEGVSAGRRAVLYYGTLARWPAVMHAFRQRASELEATLSEFKRLPWVKEAT